MHMLYNGGMKITKTAAQGRATDKSEFSFSDKRVQGATIGKKEGETYVISPKRYKLYCEGKMRILIVKGKGFVKWKRGEIAFEENDALFAEEAGEFELNGDCEFVYEISAD
mgnify:FL=1